MELILIYATCLQLSTLMRAWSKRELLGKGLARWSQLGALLCWTLVVLVKCADATVDPPDEAYDTLVSFILIPLSVTLQAFALPNLVLSTARIQETVARLQQLSAKATPRD